MCLANKFLTRFEELSNEMESEFQRLKKLEVVYNKKLNEHYHDMETAKFNAVEGYYKAKELQDIVRQRRVIKNELYKLTRVREKMRLNTIIQRSNTARQSLSHIHKHEENNDWSREWKDNYRVEDLDIQLH